MRVPRQKKKSTCNYLSFLRSFVCLGLNNSQWASRRPGPIMMKLKCFNLARTHMTAGSGLRVSLPQFTMTTLAEITDLFARLASRLKSLNDTSFSPHTAKEELYEAALDVSISKLNQPLNPNGNARVRVLDTVLSLMCFKAPQVSSPKLGIFLIDKKNVEVGIFLISVFLSWCLGFRFGH